METHARPRIPDSNDNFHRFDELTCPISPSSCNNKARFLYGETATMRCFCVAVVTAVFRGTRAAYSGRTSLSAATDRSVLPNHAADDAARLTDVKRLLSSIKFNFIVNYCNGWLVRRYRVDDRIKRSKRCNLHCYRPRSREAKIKFKYICEEK